MKLLPLIGPKALQAFSAFGRLLVGLKMTPAYQLVSVEDFFESFHGKTDAEKETAVRLAVALVDLYSDEIEKLTCFATDRNGVPITETNLKKMPLKEIFEAVVGVCMEIGRIKIDLVTPEEKKSSENLASISAEHT